MLSFKSTVLTCCCGGMEIAWRYAWTLFLSLLIVDRNFPSQATVAVFMIALVVSRFAQDHCRRVYQSLLVHGIGFTIAWSIIAHRLFYAHTHFFNLGWIQDVLGQLHALGPLVQHLSAAAGLLLIWLGARLVVTRDIDYDRVCIQFDKGIGALFGLLLIRWVADARGGVVLNDPATQYLVLIFMICSLVAIGLSRPHHAVEKTYRPGFQRISMVLSFVALATVAAAILSGPGLPVLTRLADTTQGVVKDAAAPMGPAVVSMLRFLFSIGKEKKFIESPPGPDTGSIEISPSTDMGTASGISLLVAGLLGVLILVCMLGLLYLLMNWLLARRNGGRPRPVATGLLRWLLFLGGAVWEGCWQGLQSLYSSKTNAVVTHAAMRRWGRRSGLPADPAETPLEYGHRLGRHFPSLTTEIDAIVDAFNTEAYGTIRPDEEHLGQIRSALCKMRQLRYWPVRLKGWLLVE